MKAEKSVINSNGEVVGFMCGGVNFRCYSQVYTHIGLFDNLVRGDKNTITIREGSAPLPVATLVDYNKFKLNQIRLKNPYRRRIQDEFHKWKHDDTRSILTLIGRKGIGKTSELRKFALSQFEYVVYVDCAKSLEARLIYDLSDRDNLIPNMQNLTYQLHAPLFINSEDTIVILDHLTNIQGATVAIENMFMDLKCAIAIVGETIDTVPIDLIYQKCKLSIVRMSTLTWHEYARTEGVYKLLDKGYTSLTTKEREQIECCYSKYLEYVPKTSCLKWLANNYQHCIGNLFPYELNVAWHLVQMVLHTIYLAQKQYSKRETQGLKDIVFQQLLANRQYTLDCVTAVWEWLVKNDIIRPCDAYLMDERKVGYMPEKWYYFSEINLLNDIAEQVSGSGSKAPDNLIHETALFNDLYALCKKASKSAKPAYGYVVQNDIQETPFIIKDKYNRFIGLIRDSEGVEKAVAYYKGCCVPQTIKKGTEDEYCRNICLHNCVRIGDPSREGVFPEWGITATLKHIKM